MHHAGITRHEWFVTIPIAVMVIAIQQIPYALGYALAQPGTEYMGLLINIEVGIYLSAIGQGIKGAWLYRLPFTTEEHPPAFIQVFYLALGHAARALDLSATAMWHLARVLADLIWLIVLYAVIARLLGSSAQRRVAYALAIFPAFIVLGARGQNAWVNRAIVYLAFPLQLYLSAQFVLWGWVG
ncbi:MAG: hypothetical protein FJ009_14525 [Chloroflexi bacterium]|nr:hypothetical protein [Chloroflexota bacterium]